MTGHNTHDALGGSADPQDLLLVLADTLDDLEENRKALANRFRALTTPEVVGEKGGSFGKGIPADHPVAARIAGLLEAITSLEHEAELELKRTLRTHPLGGWVKRTVGVGEKQAARLLAAIGDPGTRATVSQLWAYCGYHVLHPGHGLVGTHSSNAGVHPSSNPGHTSADAQSWSAGVAPTRTRGQKANWSNTAKMRAYLVAESCIKQRTSPYRKVYDDGRAKYAEATHQVECKRCGPSGRPAPVGSPLSDGHKHARAMRLVAKAILRDLWIEARRTIGASLPKTPASGGLGSAPIGQASHDAHSRLADGGDTTGQAA